MRGIGPPGPDQVSRGVKDPAFPDHQHDPGRPDAERERATRTPDTVRGVRLSMSPGNRTHSRAVFGNGLRRESARGPVFQSRAGACLRVLDRSLVNEVFVLQHFPYLGIEDFLLDLCVDVQLRADLLDQSLFLRSRENDFSVWETT